MPMKYFISINVIRITYIENITRISYNIQNISMKTCQLWYFIKVKFPIYIYNWHTTSPNRGTWSIHPLLQRKTLPICYGEAKDLNKLPISWFYLKMISKGWLPKYLYMSYEGIFITKGVTIHFPLWLLDFRHVSSTSLHHNSWHS